MARWNFLVLMLWSCGSSPPAVDPLDWIATGIEPEREAEAVVANLARANLVPSHRIEVEGAIAVELRGPDDRRAIRIITSRGVALALDSVDEGLMHLIDTDTPDVDGDGRPDILVGTERGADDCLAIYRVEAEGMVTRLRLDASAIAGDACATELRDLDADGRREAIIHLSWSELALEESIPHIEVPIYPRNGGYPYEAPPVSWLDRERGQRRTLLETVRTQRLVAEASRMGVELAALANLDGASLAAQIEIYDEAMSGLVLRPEEVPLLARARAFIAGGWRRTR